jgi:prevent-host-death family protein
MSAMRHRTIPQRELRNNVSAVLREAQAGTHFTITVRGRPVARLVPFSSSTPQGAVDPGPRAPRDPNA